MKSKLLKTGRLLVALGGVALLGACASQPGEFHGRQKTPVVVMAEDSSPNTLPRSSDVYKRVSAGLKGSMARQGYTIRDEDFVAAKMGWSFHDRQDKSDLVEAAKLMNNSRSASTRARTLVLYRVNTSQRDAGYGTVVHARLDGEIYDISGNRFLDSFELPMEKFSAPADCGQACLSSVIGKRTRAMAQDLGNVLARKLNRYADLDTVRRDTPDDDDRPVYGDSDTYKVTLAGFDTEEALEIMRVMSSEFPGYRDHDLIRRDGRLREYDYETRASRAKMEKWLNILLADMGFDTDRDVRIFVQGQELLVEKTIGTPPRSGKPQRPRGKGRFH